MPYIKQYQIAWFNEKHSPTEDQQFMALVEELGELAEAYNTDASDECIAEELADIIFIARTLAEMRDINISRAVNETARENNQKDTSTEGQKITKSSDADA